MSALIISLQNLLAAMGQSLLDEIDLPTTEWLCPCLRKDLEADM